jgi:hypothetical protein
LGHARCGAHRLAGRGDRGGRYGRARGRSHGSCPGTSS